MLPAAWTETVALYFVSVSQKVTGAKIPLGKLVSFT